MSYVAVILEIGQKRLDLALPMSVPSRLLVNGLIEKIGLKKKCDQVYILSLKTDYGLRPIPANATLADALVLHGSTLALIQDDRPKEADLPETGAFLRFERGGIFSLIGRETLIGRTDAKSGVFVDVDLSPYLTDPKIVSRRHAQIQQDGDRFYLVDLASVNGSKLNGEQIKPKERKPLWDGDMIEFGRGGTTLTFVNKKDT